MSAPLLVSGFTQSGVEWGAVAEALGGLAVGVNEWMAAGPWGAAHRLAEHGRGRRPYVGYSMGGRVCLHLALARPELVERLVLVGASPGIRDPGERTARRAADEAWASVIERDGVARFLERWLAQPPFASLAPDPADLAARRRQPPEILAAALRAGGTGVQDDLWPRLAELAMPVLLLAGERDAKFAAIAAEMAAAIGPHALVELVAGAGHACHLERPGAFVAAVRPFLHRASPMASSAP